MFVIGITLEKHTLRWQLLSRWDKAIPILQWQLDREDVAYLSRQPSASSCCYLVKLARGALMLQMWVNLDSGNERFGFLSATTLL